MCLDDLHQTDFGVDGELYLSIGGECFPALQWREPVSAVLEHWIPQLISYAYRHTDSCVLAFMDGPYYAKLYRDKDGQEYVICYRNQHIVYPKTQISLHNMSRSVVKCLRTYERMLYIWNMSPCWTKELSILNCVIKQN